MRFRFSFPKVCVASKPSKSARGQVGARSGGLIAAHVVMES